jgi:hypothetical protein
MNMIFMLLESQNDVEKYLNVLHKKSLNIKCLAFLTLYAGISRV